MCCSTCSKEIRCSAPQFGAPPTHLHTHAHAHASVSQQPRLCRGLEDRGHRRAPGSLTRPSGGGAGGGASSSSQSSTWAVCAAEFLSVHLSVSLSALISTGRITRLRPPQASRSLGVALTTTCDWLRPSGTWLGHREVTGCPAAAAPVRLPDPPVAWRCSQGWGGGQDGERA